MEEQTGKLGTLGPHLGSQPAPWALYFLFLYGKLQRLALQDSYCTHRPEQVICTQTWLYLHDSLAKMITLNGESWT